MPLIDRLRLAGLLDSGGDDDDEVPRTGTHAVSAVSAVKAVPPEETTARTSQTIDARIAGLPLDADDDPASSVSSASSAAASSCDASDASCGSDMSELGIATRAAAVQRAVDNSHGHLNVLGRADCLAERSRRRRAAAAGGDASRTPDRTGRTGRAGRRRGDPARDAPPSSTIIELTYPTGDDDAGAGFHVWGFKDGKRVYQLASPQAVQSAAGFCYVDLARLCPPAVVAVPAAAAAAAAAAAEAASPASPASSRTPPPTLEVNGVFAVRPSPLGGLGCFALRDLARGDLVLAERPLLRTSLPHLAHALARLAPADRAAFWGLHGWHPDPRASRAEQIWTANAFVAGELDALFALASRFNHACAASPQHNVGYRYDRRQGVLVLTAARRVAAGAELLITYGKSARLLRERFGFVCGCGTCAGEWTETATAAAYRRMWS